MTDMSIRERVFLVIYRVKEKGLEILLVKDGDRWALPKGDELDKSKVSHEVIPLQAEDEPYTKAVAIEADWHEIPSLRNLIKEDVKNLKNAFWDVLPRMEKSAYVAVREVFKKVMPKAQYEMIRELKDIITDRNSTKYL